MRIRAQVCVSTSATWRLLRPSPYTYTYAYTYTYVYSYTHICMYMCATRMHLSNLRKLIRCVFPRNSHVSLESQEVDPMRFPARGTSDEDDPMSLRTRRAREKRASSCPRKVVSGILNKLKIHEFPRRNHDFACFPLSSVASTLLVREPGLNPRKKHYIQHVSNP